MTMLGMLLLVVLMALLVAIVAVVVLLVRLRMIGRIVGTFECWVRPDASSGWISGMARFGSEEFQWFRLIAFAYGPQYRFPRGTTALSQPITGTDGKVVEVTLIAEGQRLYLALSPQWYNGLVSWLESGPPKPSSALTDPPKITS